MKSFAVKVFNSILTLLACTIFYNRLAYWILRCALDDKGKSHYETGTFPLKELHHNYKDFSLCHPERSEGSSTPVNLKCRYRK